MEGWLSCQHCFIAWYVTRPSCAAAYLGKMWTPHVPHLMKVWNWYLAMMASWGIICIPNRFTVPRGSLVACMLPRELRWGEVAPPHKGMTQCLAWAGVIIMYHVKHCRNDLVICIRCYINGLLLFHPIVKFSGQCPIIQLMFEHKAHSNK